MADNYINAPSDMAAEPGAGDGVQPAAKEQALAPEPPRAFAGLGKLLEEEDDAKVFKAVHKIVVRHEKLAKNREEARKHWSRVRRGVPFALLDKSEDRAVWKAKLPPGVTDDQAPIPNKADDLCSKIVSQITTDPFQPDPKPATDSDAHRAAADLAKRFLKADGDESGTNDAELIRDCLDTAQTSSSTFVHVWVDEQGGGWRPKQIMAHPLAMDPANPLVAPPPAPDPMTGQLAPPAPTTDYALRYVTADGQFTEDPSQADRQWLPKHKRDVLLPPHVRTVPASADVANAEKVLLLMCQPLTDVKRRFPSIRDLDDDKTLKALTEWRPPRAKVLVPGALRTRFQSKDEGQGAKANDEGGSVDDDALVFWYQLYCTIGGDYPDGANIAVSGALEGYVLGKDTLRADVPGAENEGVVPILMDVPVSQCKLLHDSEDRDPFGRTSIEKYASGNEARAQLYGGTIEDVDRRLHANVFIPGTSTVQDWQITQRTGEPIKVLSKDDMPTYEQFAELPAFLPMIIDKIEQGMDNAAGLNQTAQGLESPNSVSGKAKELVIGQGKVNLAPIYQNTAVFVKRYWRIKLQLAQAKLTVPQQVEYTGTDASYKQRWWTGADFGGVKDVAIQPGSGTMMAPVEKQNYIGAGQNFGWLDPDEAAEVGRSTLSDDLGLATRPEEDRVNREIASWLDGPPEGWTPAAPMVDPTGQPMVDPMTGQPAMQPPSWTPFMPRPTNADPVVARTRYRKLRGFVETGDYLKHPPEWRALLDAAFEEARQAGGVATVAEQQMAAQQQADAAAADKDAGRAHQSGEKDKDRQAQSDRQLAKVA